MTTKVKIKAPPTIEEVENYRERAVALLEEGEAMMGYGPNGNKRLGFSTGRPLALFLTHLEEGIYWLGRMLEGMEEKKAEKLNIDDEDTGIES